MYERGREDSGPPRVDTRVCWQGCWLRATSASHLKSAPLDAQRGAPSATVSPRYAPTYPIDWSVGSGTDRPRSAPAPRGSREQERERSALGPAHFRRGGAAFFGKQSRDVALVGVGCGGTRSRAPWRAAGASKGKGTAFGGCMDSRDSQILKNRN